MLPVREKREEKTFLFLMCKRNLSQRAFTDIRPPWVDHIDS